MAMDEEGVQKAWNMMSQHNDALMLENEELKKQIRMMSIWTVLKFRFLYAIGRM
jgi:hypothetical protein